MTPDLGFDFLVDRVASTLTVRREFAGRRQLVWDCHTRSDLLDQWFAPKPLTTLTKVMDFREGGSWHYAMVDLEGHEHWGRFDYLTVDPIDGYSALDGFCDATGALDPALPRSRWDVTFAETGGRTLVRTVVGYASAKDLDTVIGMGMQDGLTSTLKRLDELLSKLNQHEDLK